MNILSILGALSFLLGVILFLPSMQRRAMERDMKGIFIVPVIHIAIGFVAFLIGIWSHANPP